MNTTTFSNTAGVHNIICNITTRNFCPLGNAWYSNQFTVKVAVDEILVDYLYIDQCVKDMLDGKALIIEDAVATMFNIFKDAGFNKITVSSVVKDASHFPVEVIKTYER